MEVNGEVPCTPQDADESVFDVHGEMQIHNAKGVLSKIANILAERLTSDVVLLVGDKRYAAHRVILCASSRVFEVMLMNSAWREFGDNVVTLQEDEKCQAVFPQFLRYMYVGEITVTIDTAVYIMKLADKYNVHDVVVLCAEFMKSHIGKAAMKGYLIEWLHNSLLMCTEQSVLVTTLENYLKWNFDQISAQPEWVNLSENILEWLLQQNDLAVKSEYQLYERVDEWLTNQKKLIDAKPELLDEDKLEQISEIADRVLVHVRYPMMSVSEMAEVLVKSQDQQYKKAVIGLVANGMNFHVLGYETHTFRQSHEHIATGGLQFTPRIYTDDLWSLKVQDDVLENAERYHRVASVFFSPVNFHEREDSRTDAWEVEFYPFGVRYMAARIIDVNYNPNALQEIPEAVIRTVRVRVGTNGLLEGERRFMIGVLVFGREDDDEYIVSCRVQVAYFSNQRRVINIDDIIPFDELQWTSEDMPNQYMVGQFRDKVKIQVVIVPLNPYSDPYSCDVKSS
uniref:Putative transport and golgi organization n=1 Tax=Anopheles braziliensis TaxID=58242 RepID=A0A2M3Z4P5_9DIPT